MLTTTGQRASDSAPCTYTVWAGKTGAGESEVGRMHTTAKYLLLYRPWPPSSHGTKVKHHKLLHDAAVLRVLLKNLATPRP